MAGVAYEKDWADLTGLERTEAEVCGYTKESWDGDIIVPIDNEWWSDLTWRQRHALEILGYTKKTWNGSAGGVEGSTLRVVTAGKIQQQIEYYLSDANLKHDTFFHDKISSSDSGWLDITYILTSKKMKELGATKKLVVAASLKSEVFEVDDEISAVRRMNNRPLPPLEPKGRGKGKGKGKNTTGKGRGDPDNQKKERKKSYDPEGLFIALKKLLHSVIGEEKNWVITRGDSQAHEDENDNVSPHLFCKKIPKGSNAMKAIMGQELTPAQAAGGPGEIDGLDLLYFRPFTVDELKEWFNATEDDDDDDEIDWKELAENVQRLFDQHGTQQFSYRMDYHDDDENGELATIDGIGVATRSGWAIGFEASPIYHDP